MEWTVRGMDEATRRRAEAAAAAAGVSLSAWLDRTILANADSYVPPAAWPSRGETEDGDDRGEAPDDALGGSLADPAAQAAIQQALDALEARLDSRAAQVASMVTPIAQKLDQLAAADGPAPQPVLTPSPAYRRGLGLIAGLFLLLSLGGSGSLVWLWFEMQEPPPTPYAEIDPGNLRQPLSPAARPAMPPPANSPAPAGAAPDGVPGEYADLEHLIAQSRAGRLTVADASGAVTTAADAPRGSSTIAQASPRAAAPAPTQNAASPAALPAVGVAGDAQLIAQLRASAAKNDAKAQHDLALLLMEGRLLPRDERTATELFEKAAMQGLANAQYNLGVIYDNAIGRSDDQTMAYFWYSAAADQGHIAAQYNLGVAAAQGKGAPRDYAVAALWFDRAASGGLPDAQYNLGQMYEAGLGVPLELETAYDLYAAAAAQGYPPARPRMIALESRIGPQPAASLPAVPQRSAAANPQSAPNAPPTLTRKDITELQTLLRKLVLLQGAADGNIGPATRTAIRQYQTMAGLPANGEPSLDLLQELREVAGAN